jgi:hypothetical protein
MSTTTAFDDESKVSNVIAMVAGTLAIGTLTTAARFYTRLFIVKNLGIDDWVALLSLVGPPLNRSVMLVPALTTRYSSAQ